MNSHDETPIVPNYSGLEKLERQLERSQFFTHTALGKNFVRTDETAAFVHGLIDVLLAKGLLNEEELKSAITKIHEQMEEQEELIGPGTAIRLEEAPNDPENFVKVDCQSRLHICKAICCKLNFALSINEIETGIVKWDLGQPYFIRHEVDGYCTHLQHDCGQCNIYSNRPGVCRTYSCYKDSRIWKDFEKMELNTEWITKNLPPHVEERRVGTKMQ